MTSLHDLRPGTLEQFHGQDKIKRVLKIYLEASKIKKESIDHIIISGPPGVGKTSLAYVISNELNRKIITISAPNIEKLGDIITLLLELEENDILFIDEIHRLPKNIEETLYSALDENKVVILLNKTSGTEPVTINLPRFTLCGATTRHGDVSQPLLSRFGINLMLVDYSEKELAKIILENAKIMNLQITNGASFAIAQRSKKNPRMANQLLKRLADFAIVWGNCKITISIVERASKMIGIDKMGLDEFDIKYLCFLRQFEKPVGINNVAHSLGVDHVNILEHHELYLLKINFIKRTHSGRIITTKGSDYLKNNY